jgi:7-keto-8-aminopelargonate synthetase-like enzyme/non-ribosomal peptide synthetase component F
MAVLMDRFTFPGGKSEAVLAAVIAAHRLLDGYFRRKIVVIDFGSGLPTIALDPGGASGSEPAAGRPLDEACLESLEPYLNKGIHLISHRAGGMLAGLAGRLDPYTVAAVEQEGNDVTVSVTTPREPGSDLAFFSQLDSTIRALLTAGERPRPDAAPPGPWPTSAGRHQLDRPPLFISRFHELAERYPTRPAVEYRDVSLTYAQLARLSDRMAQGLLDRCLGQGSRILILAARDPLLPAVVIAAFKIGAVISLLDPKLPELYLQTCAGILRPDLIVNVAGASGPGQLEVTAGAELAAHASVDDGRFRADVLAPDDCAIVCFTSGTTGVPKASAGRYGSLTEFFDWMDANTGPLAGRRFGMCSSLGHDPLQRDLMTPLYLGGRIVIPEDRDMIVPETLCRWLSARGIEVVCMNPAMAAAMSQAAPTPLPLQVVFFIGSVFSRDQAAAIRRALPDARIFNLYGSTETQRAVSYFELPSSMAAVADLPDIVPLGTGMKTVDLLVTAGEDRHPCVPFQIGEILIRSRHIGLGYLDNDALTAQKFITDGPSDDQTPYYVTGDLGYISPQYGAVYVGRADDQDKVNGYRVELNQVNVICRGHPLVRDAATVVVTVDGLPTLATWLVPVDDETEIDPLDFRSFLARCLPHYCVPSHIRTLSSMPLTANNKLDLNRLRSMITSRASVSAGGVVNAARAFVTRHTGLADFPTNVPLNDLGIDSLRFHALLSQLETNPVPSPRMERSLSPYVTLDELVGQLADERVPARVSTVDDKPPLELRPLDLLGPVTEVSETSIAFRGRKFDHLCSNSYLGLNGHPGLRENVTRFVQDSTFLGTHGSPELNGWTMWHERLVTELKALAGTEAAVLYSSCYLANISVIPALVGPGDDVFVDKNCHNSITDGCILSRARIYPFNHNDPGDLRSLLERAGGARRLIVSEGVFSIEGDIIRLPAIHALAEQYDCLLMVDEACSIGQVGAAGRGVEEHFGLPGVIDVRVGTLAKAMCADGGYAVCNEHLAAYLRFQRGAAFSSALSPLQAIIAAEAASILRHQGRALVSRLTHNAQTWRRCLTEAGLDIGASTTAIVPIHLGDEQELTRAYQRALSADVFCLPVGRPWSSDICALRTSVTAAHDAQQLEAVAARLQLSLSCRERLRPQVRSGAYGRPGQ